MRLPILGPSPQDKEAWLAERQKHVTATMVARIMRGEGFTCYHELIGDMKPFAGNGHTRRGKWFERPTLECYAEEANVLVFDQLPLLVDPDCPALAATPDAMVVPGDLINPFPMRDHGGHVFSLVPGDESFLEYLAREGTYGVEAKTSISREVATALSEGDEESDYVPDDWQVQTHCQMAVCGWQRCDMAILLYGSLTTRKIQRYEPGIDQVRAIATEYAERVAKRLPPPIVGDSEANRATVKYLYRRTAEGKTINLDDSAFALLESKAKAAAEETAAKKLKEKFDTEFCALAGDAELVLFPGGQSSKLVKVHCDERIQAAYDYSYWGKPKVKK